MMSVYLNLNFDKFKWLGLAISAILMVLGFAVYQPNVSIAISVTLIALFMEGLRCTPSNKIIKKGLIYAATLSISTFVYIKLSHIIYPNIDSTEYAGVGQMGKISLADIPQNLVRPYLRVMDFFILKPQGYITPQMRVLNLVVVALIVIEFAYCIIAIKKKWIDRLLLALLLFLLPLALGFVRFMAPEAPFSTLMIYSYAMVYVFLIALSEEISLASVEKKMLYKVTKMSFSVSALIVALVCIFSYFIDAQAYFRMDFPKGFKLL